MQQQMPMQMQGGGGGMGGMESRQMMTMMQQMQTTMLQMQEQIANQRDYIEQRDSWLESRMSQLDRRCQKVEVLSDRLYTLLNQLDVTDIAAVPKEVSKTLNYITERMDGMSSGPGTPKSPTSPTSKALRDLSNSSESALQPASDPSTSALVQVSPQTNEHHHSHHGLGHHDNHKLEEHMKTISRQMETLMSHAEATPQITRLLWRMDLNLRQLTGSAGNLPQQAQDGGSRSGDNSSSPSKRQVNKQSTMNIGGRSNVRASSKQRTDESGG